MMRIIDQASESIIITDDKGLIKYVNPHFTIQTGYDAQEVIGRTPALLKSGIHSRQFYHDLWEQISSGKIWSGNITDRRKDGSLYTSHMTISPVFNYRGRITNYVATQSDEELETGPSIDSAHIDGMESLGTFVGGIAHQFNNVLASIKSNAYLASESTQDTNVLKRLETIDRLSTKAAHTIRQMLIFARKDIMQTAPINLNKAIHDITHTFRSHLPDGTKLAIDVSDHDLIINGDSCQIEQIVVNLLDNALDAVANKESPGEIRISLAKKTRSAKKNLDEKGISTNYAVITVGDNGSGIPVDDHGRIFEPFYTTKSTDKGIGLGLAAVFGAVHSHNGSIELASREGQGSIFRVWLPLGSTSDHNRTTYNKNQNILSPTT